MILGFTLFKTFQYNGNVALKVAIYIEKILNIFWGFRLTIRNVNSRETSDKEP